MIEEMEGGSGGRKEKLLGRRKEGKGLRCGTDAQLQ